MFLFLYVREKCEVGEGFAVNSNSRFSMLNGGRAHVSMNILKPIPQQSR